MCCTDPQHSSYSWFVRSQAARTIPERLTVERIDTENALKERLEHAGDDDLVLIDVQGTLNQFQTIALVAADITVVPCKATYMDVVEAIKLFEYAKNFKRSNLRLVFNEVKTIDINTVAFREAMQPIRKHQIPVFDTMVSQRGVYAQFSKDAGTLQNMAVDPSKTIQIAKARQNVARLTAEILQQAGYE